MEPKTASIQSAEKRNKAESQNPLVSQETSAKCKCFHTANCSGKQRVSCGKPWKAAEIPVGGEKIGDAVGDTQGGNPGVMDHRSLNPANE